MVKSTMNKNSLPAQPPKLRQSATAEEIEAAAKWYDRELERRDNERRAAGKVADVRRRQQAKQLQRNRNKINKTKARLRRAKRNPTYTNQQGVTRVPFRELSRWEHRTGGVSGYRAPTPAKRGKPKTQLQAEKKRARENMS